MPKVTNGRKYCGQKLIIRQRTITECFKAPYYFLPKEEQIKHLLNTKQIATIKDYDKKNYLPKEKEFRKQLKKQEGLLPEHRKYWKGYMFFAINDFRDYFVISMHPKTDNNKIYKAGTQVATAIIDTDSVLTQIEVEVPFQNQKIGSELIRFISQRASNFMVFGGTDNNSRYRLTLEGARLITSCVKNGILKTEQVIMSCPPSPAT